MINDNSTKKMQELEKLLQSAEARANDADDAWHQQHGLLTSMVSSLCDERDKAIARAEEAEAKLDDTNNDFCEVLVERGKWKAQAAEAYNDGLKMGHKNNEYREGLWDAERDRLQDKVTELEMALQALKADRGVDKYEQQIDGLLESMNKIGEERDRLQAELEEWKESNNE